MTRPLRRRALWLYGASWCLLLRFVVGGAAVLAGPGPASHDAALFAWLSLLAVVGVARSPKLGHSAWHFMAAYSLFVWWE